MRYDVTTKHFELSEENKAKIGKSLSKLDRYSDRIIGTHVILELTGSRHRVELNVKTRSSLFNAHETSYALDRAVDEVVRKVERQLRKHIDRLQQRKTQTTNK